MRKPEKSNVVTTALEQPPAAPVGGRRTISALLEHAFWFQLKQISIDRDIPIRTLMQEAFNDLFVKYGKEPVAMPAAQAASSGKSRVETSFEIPKQFDVLFERWMAENDWSGTELLRKALSLFEVAQEAREQGNRLGVLSRDRRVVAEIIGL